MTIDSASGLIQWTPTLAQRGDHSVQVLVTDLGGLFDTQDFTVTVSEAPPANEAPQVDAGAAQTITLPTSNVALNATVSDDGLPNPPAGLSLTWSQDGGTGVIFGDPHAEDTTAALPGAGSYVLRLTADDGALSNFDTVTITVNPEGSLPPDPKDVAPLIDPTVATTTFASTEFLYTGNNPIQTGVDPGTMDPKRVAVMRGRVLDKQDNPLSGVTVSILNHAEFGQTLSRADGWFDLAVNGGGYLTVFYQKTGYLPVQRTVNVPWQDWVVVDDVVMIARDPQVSLIDLTSNASMQVAEGGVVNDSRGLRQAALLIPQGVTAQVYDSNGNLQPVSQLHLTMTEYTVGANGPQAMPAPLPPTSGYTYAVEMSADEAITKIAGKDVLFSAPVFYYLDNFIHIPVGIPVPVGYYDRDKAAWIPSPDGMVIKILSITNDLADIDTDGDDSADIGLGITDAERQILAARYSAGKTLWRIPLTHLSTYDHNYGRVPPTDSRPPEEGPPQGGDKQKPDSDDQCQASGSLIECQSQILRESLPVVGTNLTLNYASDRMPGRKTDRTLAITLSGTSVPASLKSIELEISVAGRKLTQSFPPLPNQTFTFAWDGTDAYGQTAQGAQPGTVRVGYRYDAFYALPPSVAASFGATSGQPIPGPDPVPGGTTLWQEYPVQVGGLGSSRTQGLNGWSLDVHHQYEPLGRVLYEGNGTRRSAENENTAVITTVAGGGSPLSLGDGGPAVDAWIEQPWAIAVGADGSLYIATGSCRVRRVGPDGIISTIAGKGTYGFSGDGGPAVDAETCPYDLAVGPDGSLYLADYPNYRVRRIGPDGIITTVAGNGNWPDWPPSGDGGLAIDAALDPLNVAVGADGTLYISDNFWYVRRVGPDGILSTLTEHEVGNMRIRSAVDGSLYIGSEPWYNPYVKAVYRLGPDGTLQRVAGGGTSWNGGSNGVSGDGGLATDALLSIDPYAIAVGTGNDFYFVESQVVRHVGSDGIITSVMGTNNRRGFDGDGGLAAAAVGGRIIGLALAGRELYLADLDYDRVRRIGLPLPGFNAADLAIPSAEGELLYRFSAEGRHLSTLNARTGAIRYRFGYDANGQLTSITDGDNNVTTITRDGNGHPTRITAPFGQVTTLTTNADGWLSSVTNPAGETYAMGYTADGLLTRFQKPSGHASTMTYDSLGFLLTDSDAAGGSQTLNRVPLPLGYQVTRTTAEGRIAQHQVETLTTGDRRYTDFGLDGLSTVRLTGTNGVTTTTQPDTTVKTATEHPDPRFGMQSPLTDLTVATGGLTAVITTTRTADLAIPNDPLSLQTLTDTQTVNGRTSTAVFDVATRTLTSTSPAGRVTTSVLDAQGRPVRTEQAGLAPVLFDYDAQGRLQTLTHGEGLDARTATFAYGADGLLASTSDALAQSTDYAHDLAGRTTRQVYPDGNDVLFDYDPNGNLTALTPPARPAHGFDYTPVDRMAAYTPPTVPGDGATNYQYNLDKQLTQVTRPDGALLTYGYDSGGRLATLTTPAGQYAYGYDPSSGQLSQITAPDGGTLGYGYDGALLTALTWAGTVSGSVGFAYDNDFRITDVMVNGADPIAYAYDLDSLLVQAGDLALSRAPANGLLTGTTLGNVTENLTYNSFGETSQYSAAQGGTPLLDIAYTRDALGRITQKAETVGGVITTYDYAYDLAGRLAEVQTNGAVTATYTYDANGNRLTAPNLNTVPVYDDQDRLLQYGDATYTYTTNGELLTKTENGQTTTYAYDVLGNLNRVDLPDGTVIEYVIDAKNRRVGKKVNGTLVQSFLYQDQLKPIAELDGSGSLVSRFVYATGVNVPDYLIKSLSKY